jgi:hypothetical protein
MNQDQIQNHPSVPQEVFYVVQTSSGTLRKRHRGVRPRSHAKRHQAQVELIHLQMACSGAGTYSIWKATAYAEPAEWLHDVVVANGSVVRLRGRNSRQPSEPVWRSSIPPRERGLRSPVARVAFNVESYRCLP